MIITYNREKLINMIIFFVKNTKKCFKTKLFKLLYNADFIHFKQTGRSISGLDYFAWKYGPVPTDLYEEFTSPKEDFKKHIQITNMGDKCIISPKSKFNDIYFSPRELKILELVAFIFKDADTDTVIESTHIKNHPWDKTIRTKGERKKIEYELAFDDSPDSITYEKHLSKLEEIRDTERIFLS